MMRIGPVSWRRLRRSLRLLILGCPVCGHRRQHLTYCRWRAR